SASTNAGKFGIFVSGSRAVTDMRREPVAADVDSTTNSIKSITNFHNHGEDLFAFGKVQFVPNDRDVVNLVTNWSRTTFRVPYDSPGGVLLDDTQRDVNSFVNLGWNHRAKNGSELFVGAFHRRGSLAYTPGSIDTPQFVFFPDTLTPFNLRESRNF